MSILIKSARIINDQSPYHLKKQDILIGDDGKIKQIGQQVDNADRIISGKNLHVSIGWFDLNAHFNDPGFEYKEDLQSGRAVAAAGGFTEVALLPNTQPVIQTKNDIRYINERNVNELVQLHAIGAVTRDCKGEDLTEMIDMHTAGAVAFSDGQQPVWNTDILLKSLLYLQKFDGLLMDKPEDRHLSAFGTMNEGHTSTILGLKGIPKLAEEIIIRRDIELLNYAGGKLHFSNISTYEAVRLIKAARKRGLSISCDVAISHLIFSDEELTEYDTNFKVAPPLREEKDIKALIKALKEGTIEAIVTAHSPHDTESKKLEFDLAENGMLTMQTMLPMLVTLSESIELPLLIDKVTVGPRKLLGRNIPMLQEGEKANLTIFDPDLKWKYDMSNNLSKSRNSPYLNRELTGKVIGVINNNQAYFNPS